MNPDRVAYSIRFGLVHWALLAVVQAENVGLRRLGWLPLMQAENACAAVLVALLALAAAGRVWSRWIFFAGFAVVTLLVALDPSYYLLFEDHFRLSMGEGAQTMDPLRGLSSFTAMLSSAKGVLLLNGLVAVLSLVWLGRQQNMGPIRCMGAMLWASALALVLCLVPRPADLANATHHPFFPLLQEAVMRPVTAGLSAKAGDDAPLDAKPSTAPALASAAARIRAASPKPNIVLIILESVGAPQLLTAAGLPDPKNTPNLAALARSAVVFDSVYAVFPGTVRNHLAINTGGFNVTWSSVFDTLHRDFTGPLIGRDFARAGYATALFSSERLDVEAMDIMESRAGWGTLYDFGRDVKNHTSDNVLNSWGAREEFTMKQIEPWLEANRSGPFLLAYMNAATHHPYSVPRGFAQPNGIATARARYLNSVHYTDAVIGQLIAMLKARGLYENTIIAVTGDHGEAFGEHPGNFTHKNAIYDENVRCFLLLAHPALGGTTLNSRVASSGDIYPTLAALAAQSVKTPGIDLLTRDFPARAVSFMKNAFPEQWGRRDGRWKFIETIRERQAELYDLTADPTEQRNLAAAHPDLVARFSAQSERWYLRSDAECTSQFVGYTPPDWQRANFRTYGPKFLNIVGTPPAAESVWVADSKEHTFALIWQAPDGTRHRAEQKLGAGNFRVTTPCPAPLPLAPGEWTVILEEAGQELLRTTFPAR